MHFWPVASFGSKMLQLPNSGGTSTYAMFNATLIVASCGSELDWLDALLAREPGLQAVIVEQCTLRRASGRRVSIVSAPRCGREAGSYLLYIIRQWVALPVHLFFMQGDAPRHWCDDQQQMRFSNCSDPAAGGAGEAVAKARLKQMHRMSNGRATFAMLTGFFSSNTCHHTPRGPGIIWRVLQRRGRHGRRERVR